MAAIFYFVLSILGSTVLHFTRDVADKARNGTMNSLFATPASSLSGLRDFLSGGSGGPDDENPHDFRPGRWNLFPFVDFDPLLWYDLQWYPPEKTSLFPKNWYEDEELAFAWNSILTQQRLKKVVAQANTECHCHGACNCKTFASVKPDTGLMYVYLKHPVTLETIQLHLKSNYAGEELHLLSQVSRVFDMNLENWWILVDGQPMKLNRHLQHGSLIEVIPRLPGGVKGSKRFLKPLSEKRTQQSAAENGWEESDEEAEVHDEECDDRRSLLEESTRYHVPRLTERRNSGEISDVENVRDSTSRGDSTLIRGKGRSDQIRTAKNTGDKSFDGTSKRKQKALSDKTIEKIMAEKCCKNRCIQRKLTKQEIVKSRKAFQELNEDDRRSLIMNLFQLSYFHRTGRRRYTFRLNGKEICRIAWLRANSVSATTFHRLQREIEHEGRISPESARIGRQITKPRRLKAEAWFRDYIEDCADPIPNDDRFSLPTCMTKSEIYNTYVEEMKGAGIKPISLVTFFRMWKNKFRNVVIYKENKFTKCGVCVALKLCLQGTTDKEKRQSFAYRRKLHNEQQMAERRAYYRNCLKAEVSPKQYLSLIIDGMDQSKTNLPHANCLSKDETYHFLRTHITGAISHGHGRIFSFIDLMRWPHDSNLTLNVLLKIFMELAEEGQLPPYLCIQLDNCYRECKNRYILGFCALLVEKEIFKEVYLSFLMVGHTHEDIDQFFSRIAKRLRRMDSMTLPELKANIRLANTPEPETHVMHFIYDIRGWIEPCLNPIKYHAYPHAYKFAKIDGRAVMKYKQWATDENWLPEGPGKILLAKKPKGIPPLVRPDAGKMMELDALEDCIKKCRRLTAEQRSWWTNFLQHEKRYRQKWSAASEDYLSEVKRHEWYLDKLQKHRPLNELRVVDKDQEEREKNLEHLLDKANHCPEVIVGQKRKTTNKAMPPTKKKRK